LGKRKSLQELGENSRKLRRGEIRIIANGRLKKSGKAKLKQGRGKKGGLKEANGSRRRHVEKEGGRKGLGNNYIKQGTGRGTTWGKDLDNHPQRTERLERKEGRKREGDQKVQQGPQSNYSASLSKKTVPQVRKIEKGKERRKHKGARPV